MSLWFELCIQSKALGLIEIIRQDPIDLTDPDIDAENMVCTYRVTLDGVHAGNVTHCRADGALALAGKATLMLADRVDTLHTRERRREPAPNPPLWGAGG